MGKSLFPLRDTFPIPRKTKKSLKRQMARWLRRLSKKKADEVPRTRKHGGWYW